MELTFVRSFVRNTWYKDLGVSISQGYKFDFYQNGELTGTLIDDDSTKTISQFKNGDRFVSPEVMRYPTEREQNFDQYFSLWHGLGNELAQIWLYSDTKRNKHLAHFRESGKNYELVDHIDRFSSSGYRCRFSFIENGHTACEIFAQPVEGPWWKRFFNLKFEGIIRMDRELTNEHLTVFVLMMSREWQLNHVAKFTIG